MKLEYILGGIVVVALAAGGAAYFVTAKTDAPARSTAVTDSLTAGETGKSNGPIPGIAPARTLTVDEKAARYTKAPEIASPAGFVNTGGKPVTIGEFKGKRVVLIDFWTYSCINCQRTLPYMRAWYDKYHDRGLEIIAIHTPEFSFEKIQDNVQKAADGFGLKYPSVLDNEYGTWNAFGNHYWPRKYLIDIDGYIVYDHAGEGNYDETERAIQKALAERDARLGAPAAMPKVSAPANPVTVDPRKLGSPETYFGAARNVYLGNGAQGKDGPQTFTLPANLLPNTLYLGGVWDFTQEYSQNTSAPAQIRFVYDAKDVYLVAASAVPVKIKVTRDGGQSLAGDRGADVDENGEVLIQSDRLYKLVEGADYGVHTLEIEIESPGLEVYTFTFG